MAYVKSNSSTTAWGRLHYIFDEAAHDGGAHRVLAVTGSNIRLWGSSNRPYQDQSGYYLNKQFKKVRQKAWNKHKRHQAQHMIISFSENEFPTDNPDNIMKEASRVNELINGFMAERFADSQWVSAVQCDGTGHKLHAHVLINTVKINGKCVRTNNFKVNKLRNEWNKYLDSNYLSVTGHVYVNPFSKDEPGTRVKPKGWQAQLQQTLDWAREKADSIKEYLELLKDKNVTVSERNKRGDWSYHVAVSGKEKTVRDFYQRTDRKTGLVKSTRGMGKDYTPSSLKKYFGLNKMKGNEQNDQEVRQSDGRFEQLARESEQQREQRFIKRLINERVDEEQQDGTSNKTGSPKPIGGSNEATNGSHDDSGLGF
ncbi:hypothetical protein BSQ39_09065 [Loigolactobacillus backii]|uniref:relaxase/mobilization nuclease domain-containing protein n=1 Tax=Loigolactobacillus backii TaxID=375175 RepID=UPI000C1C9763|nr:relaxase/mobilization nuclease domain-containing protein [Loigolactobacillus backii]PIO83705.1 hypothetical protein BSQ39_09065 [Loigolactobacillus backii]